MCGKLQNIIKRNLKRFKQMEKPHVYGFEDLILRWTIPQIDL